MLKEQSDWVNQVVATTIFAATMIFGACSAAPSGGTAPEEPPDSVVQWEGVGGGFQKWGGGGKCLYGLSAKPEILDVWRWEGNAVKRHAQVRPAGPCLDVAALGDDTLLLKEEQPENGKWLIHVRSARTGQAIRKLPPEKGWYVRTSHPSQNAKYVAIWSSPEKSVPGYDFDAPEKLRLGLIDAKAEKIEWTATVTGTSEPESSVRAVIPSDDGAYIAVAGWDNGAVVVSVAKKKVLWQKRPKDEVNFTDIAFTLDNKLVYAGGAEGCVYGMKVQDGEIVSRWFASPTGKSEYGHRISTISVSPDGRFVAAGTGPVGYVFLFSTKTESLVKLLRPAGDAGSTVLVTSFSPDSSHIAAFDGGRIMVWTVPQERNVAPTKSEKTRKHGM